jgi:hypothetical protein
MSKLVSVIRNRFVPVPHREKSRRAANAVAVGSQNRILADAVESAASLHWRLTTAARIEPSNCLTSEWLR